MLCFQLCCEIIISIPNKKNVRSTFTINAPTESRQGHALDSITHVPKFYGHLHCIEERNVAQRTKAGFTKTMVQLMQLPHIIGNKACLGTMQC